MMEKVQKHLIIVSGRIRKGDKFLIAQRALDDNFHPGHRSLVGGKVENIQGENSLQENLKKEILEEVGVEITDNMQFIGNHMKLASDGTTVLYIAFLCERKSGEAKPLEDTHAVKRVTKEEIETFDQPNVFDERKEYLFKHI